MICLSSCTSWERISWSPDFYAHDHELQEIFNEHGHIVSCHEPKFNLYLSLHRDDIAELASILRNARIPNKKAKKKAEELTVKLEQAVLRTQ